MLTPIELIKATVDGMMERRFGRIVNITSGAVKAPIDILGLSNGARAGLTGRSEEHTSELQSLMRISYAVFCLKKKKTQTLHNELQNVAPHYQLHESQQI